MGFLSNFFQVATLVGKAINDHYDEKIKDIDKQRNEIEAKLQDDISSASHYHPKILDRYYSTSRIEDITKEEGILRNDKGAYFRNNYHFLDTTWTQVFDFTPSGFLTRIILFNFNLQTFPFANVYMELTGRFYLVEIGDGEEAFNNGNLKCYPNWKGCIDIMLKRGLEKHCLDIVFIDPWVGNYIIAKAEGFPDNPNDLARYFPINGRVIGFHLSKQCARIEFCSAEYIKNAQY